MFIAAKRSVSRRPSGGPCQPTMCERGTSNNGLLTWGASASQPRQHGPPERRAGAPPNGSINIALLTEGSTTNNRLPSRRCARHASH
jgi:hypothetical protein